MNINNEKGMHLYKELVILDFKSRDTKQVRFLFYLVIAKSDSALMSYCTNKYAFASKSEEKSFSVSIYLKG